MDMYSVVFGIRVRTERGEVGTVTHIGTGSIAGAVWVKLQSGHEIIERVHTLEAIHD